MSYISRTKSEILGSGTEKQTCFPCFAHNGLRTIHGGAALRGPSSGPSGRESTMAVTAVSTLHSVTALQWGLQVCANLRAVIAPPCALVDVWKEI